MNGSVGGAGPGSDAMFWKYDAHVGYATDGIVTTFQPAADQSLTLVSTLGKLTAVGIVSLESAESFWVVLPLIAAPPLRETVPEAKAEPLTVAELLRLIFRLFPLRFHLLTHYQSW